MTEVLYRNDIPVELIATTSSVLDGDETCYSHVAEAARRSIQGAGVRRSSPDDRLVKFLKREKHLGPFEFLDMTVQVECPLFIAMQILRHRTFSYSMLSGRYCEMLPHFWVPRVFKGQHDKKMQCSDGELEPKAADLARAITEEAHKLSWNSYQGLLSLGVSREQARAVLPEGTYTQLWMKGNLRNWSSFIELREATNAQGPIREIATKCKALLVDQYGDELWT